MSTRARIIIILKSLIEKYEKDHGFRFYAVDVMGSVARGKDNPRDLDVLFMVEGAELEEKEHLMWKFLYELEHELHSIGVGLDQGVIPVEEVKKKLMELCTSPGTFLTELENVRDGIEYFMTHELAVAILHLVKLVDEKAAALLYGAYLAAGLSRVPWHNMWIHGQERAAALVQNLRYSIRDAVAKIVEQVLYSED